MQRVPLGPWTITVDAQTTRAIHARLSAGEEERCSCPECRNFFAVEARVYPAAAQALFSALGAEPLFISELTHLGRDADGRYGCVGWFHAVGSVDGPMPQRDSALEGFDLTPDFRLWATADNMLAPKPFEGHPLVQIDFSVSVPWVLDEAPPSDAATAGEPGAAPDAPRR